ncbi:23S rRNA (uridine(2552)-2'-O)-methyltransferase [Candidatus Geothermarchaeota archaeon]|nr:MAG: 23S rRNA (uridine(2552)-2'-O)-methyltransferase [Candidatus Geothermarchaeota archaeon]
MTKKSKRWIIEKKKDHFYLMAKREGYRSRAVYKLKEINLSYKVLRRGAKVVDLGAAPGGWLQYTAETIGRNGLVIGIDKREISPLPYGNVKTFQLDVFNEDVEKLILKEAGSKVDVILSDLSPNITGVWEVDVARNVEMCDRVLEIADNVLKRNGRLILKILEGRGSQKIISKLKRKFSFVKLFRPRATRKRSAEIYAVCLGFRG